MERYNPLFKLICIGIIKGNVTKTLCCVLLFECAKTYISYQVVKESKREAERDDRTDKDDKDIKDK